MPPSGPSPLEELDRECPVPDIQHASKKKLARTRALGRVLRKQRLQTARNAAKLLIESRGHRVVSRRPASGKRTASRAVSETPSRPAGPTVDMAEAVKHLPNLEPGCLEELKKLPAVVAPSSVGKGAKNYTIFAPGRNDMSCEVQLANRCFRMRKLHEDQVWPEGVSKCVKWASQCPFAAWAQFKIFACWQSDD